MRDDLEYRELLSAPSGMRRMIGRSPTGEHVESWVWTADDTDWRLVWAKERDE